MIRSDVARAYLAGVIEGEGSISLTGSNSVAVKVLMTDADVIWRVANTAGVGTVVGPYERAGSKPHWVWAVRQAADVRDLLLDILPWMGERRSLRILVALDRLSGNRTINDEDVRRASALAKGEC